MEYPLPVVGKNSVGKIRGWTCENEKDVLREVRKHSRTYTSRRGCEHVKERQRVKGYERGEKPVASKPTIPDCSVHHLSRYHPSTRLSRQAWPLFVWYLGQVCIPVLPIHLECSTYNVIYSTAAGAQSAIQHLTLHSGGHDELWGQLLTSAHWSMPLWEVPNTRQLRTLNCMRNTMYSLRSIACRFQLSP